MISELVRYGSEKVMISFSTILCVSDEWLCVNGSLQGSISKWLYEPVARIFNTPRFCNNEDEKSEENRDENLYISLKLM